MAAPTLSSCAMRPRVCTPWRIPETACRSSGSPCGGTILMWPLESMVTSGPSAAPRMTLTELPCSSGICNSTADLLTTSREIGMSAPFFLFPVRKWHSVEATPTGIVTLEREKFHALAKQIGFLPPHLIKNAAGGNSHGYSSRKRKIGTVSRGRGLNKGGLEYTLTQLLIALALLLTGAGRYSLAAALPASLRKL